MHAFTDKQYMILIITEIDIFEQIFIMTEMDIFPIFFHRMRRTVTSGELLNNRPTRYVLIYLYRHNRP